jgi:ABC-2 type transport system ATP-binding protein
MGENLHFKSCAAMLLEARSLSKRYGATAVLRDVSFSVREGEILGLIGPNGAGKTTLFECLAGLIIPDAGEVRSSPGRGLFYVPDGIRPWQDERTGEVLRFFGSLHGAAAAVDRLANQLQLRTLWRARVGTLSKGESKRFLVALGLLTPQALLLLDEPFDGLDFRQTRDVMTVLREEAARSGRTLFLSIHQLQDAARVCDRLVLLSRGAVVGEGSLDELRARAGVNEGGLEEVFLALT